MHLFPKQPSEALCGAKRHMLLAHACSQPAVTGSTGAAALRSLSVADQALLYIQTVLLISRNGLLRYSDMEHLLFQT
jgi:hypothetical protein